MSAVDEAVLTQVRPASTRHGPAHARLGSRRGTWMALSVALYMLVALFAWWRAWSSGLTHVAPGTIDGVMSMWYLSWAPYALAHAHNPLYSNLANYPYGVNLAENAVVLPLGYIASPITLLAGPVAGYNAIGTLAMVLSASAGYVFVRRFTTWAFAAFTGGLLYGFSPFMVGQLPHINLTFAPLPPLILLVFYDLVVRQPGRPRARGALLGALLVLQFFIQSELFVDTLVVATVGVIVVSILGRRQVADKVRFAVTGMVPALAIAVVCLAYPAWFALQGPAHIVGRVQPVPQHYHADLLGALLPDSTMRFAPSVLAHTANTFGGNLSENGSYLGLPLVLLVAVTTIWLRRNRVVLVAGVMTAISYLLSLGARLNVSNHLFSGFPLPQALLNDLPVTQNMIPIRFALFVALFAALVLGIGLDTMRAQQRRRRAGRWAVALPVGLAVLCLSPLVPRWPAKVGPATIPEYYASGAYRAIPQGSVVLTYPFPNGDFALPELWQASTSFRFKMTGGTFALPQPGTGAVGNSRASLTNTTFTTLESGQRLAQDPATRAGILSELRHWQVHTVVADPAPSNVNTSIPYLTWLLGRPPVKSNGAYVWYHWR